MANTMTNLGNTILAQQYVMNAFRAAIAPFNAFARDFSAEAVQRGDKIKVFTVPAQDAATDFAGTYTVQDADAEGKDITINKHKFVSWGLTDTEIATMPQLQVESFFTAKGYQLAKAVLQDVFSVVTLANYGAAAFTGVASGFDSDDVIDIKNACDLVSMPATLRSLVLGDSYVNALLKDSSIKGADSFGNPDPIQRGSIGMLSGFSVVPSSLIPANGQNLVGMAVYPDALLVAMRYLAPQDEGQLLGAEPVTEEGGITLGYRRWYEPSTAKLISVMECNYGYAVGNAASLKRVVSA
jgi:hypothetical protein